MLALVRFILNLLTYDIIRQTVLFYCTSYQVDGSMEKATIQSHKSPLPKADIQILHKLTNIKIVVKYFLIEST